MQTMALLFKVLWSPGEAMFKLSKEPRILVPMLFLAVYSLAAGIVVRTKVDMTEVGMRVIERTPGAANFSEEQRAMVRSQIKAFDTLGLAATVVIVPLSIVVIAGLYFGVFSILGRVGGFKEFLSITSFAFVPIIFSQLAAIARAFTMPQETIMPDEMGSISLAAFLDRQTTSPAWFSAVNSVDLATMWVLALMVIGYKFVTPKSLSAGARAAGVVSLFLIYVGFKLGIAAMFGM
jgi:hypothetical protein